MSPTIVSEVECDVDSAVLMRRQGKLESTWKHTKAAHYLADNRGKWAIRISANLLTFCGSSASFTLDLPRVFLE